METTTDPESPKFGVVRTLLYCSGVVFGLVAGIVILHLLALSVRGVYWNDTARQISSWVEVKRKLAAATESPKLILLGGSNVFYGMRADVLEDRLGVRTLNFGIHGALPSEINFRELQRIARPGDAVVFAPEYSHYFRSPSELNEVSMRYVLAHNPEFLWQIGWQERLRRLMEAPPELLLARFVHPSPSWQEAMQASLEKTGEMMDERGDHTRNSMARIGERERGALAGLGPVRRLTELLEQPAASADPEQAFPRFLIEMQHWAAENGILLVFTWPNTMHFPEYDRPEIIGYIESMGALARANGIPVAGTPRAAMFPKSDFFDTVYHLHREAAQLRSQRLADDLREVIQNWFSQPETSTGSPDEG